MIRKKTLPTPSASDKTLKTATKKNLKVLRNTKEHHILREKARIVKYGTVSFARNVWLSVAAVLVMTMTLVILFATISVSVVLSNTAELMRDKIDITIYFKPGTTSQVLDDIAAIISTDSNIKSAVIATSSDEYDKFLTENQANTELISMLDDDEDMKKVILDNMQATIRIKVYDTSNLDSVKTLVASDDTIQKNLDIEKMPTYDVNQVEIATITSWANIAKNGGLVLGLVFLAISVLIIFNTIRMAIFSRREEIYMMKLVGADKGFIRGPFRIEAQICGIISGVVAATLSYLGFSLLMPKLSNWGIDVSAVASVMESNKLVLVYLAFIISGIIIGTISARLAISKYMRKA